MTGEHSGFASGSHQSTDPLAGEVLNATALHSQDSQSRRVLLRCRPVCQSNQDTPLVQYETITSAATLNAFCEVLEGADCIAFDTEFVSEDTFQPQLCLIQVAIHDRVVIIDPLEIEDVGPFWKVLTEGEHTTVAHAAREEFLFCWRSKQRRPAQLVDTQIAAGLIGMEYPASYSGLLSKLLDVQLAKGETRTDWRRRPLSSRQLDYARHDVLHLQRLADRLQERLTQLGRAAWLRAEMDGWQSQLEQFEREEQWHRVSGSANLQPRSLAIVRELWRWRRDEAQQRNQPAKRVLRDDLMVELARQKTADLQRIRSVRGMNFRAAQKHQPAIAQAIQRALELSDHECPQRPARRSTRSHLTLLTQFLSTALGSICRQARVAPGLVGNSQDIQDLVRFHLESKRDAEPSPPSLASGWRAEIVGRAIDDLLSGKYSLRIQDPLSAHPLVLEESAHYSRDT